MNNTSEDSSWTSIDTDDLIFAQDPDERAATPVERKESPELPPVDGVNSDDGDPIQDFREWARRRREEEAEATKRRIERMSDSECADEYAVELATMEVPETPQELKGVRSRHWMGTHQNMDHKTLALFRARCATMIGRSTCCEYAEIFEEIAPTTGHNHYHSIVSFKNAVRFETIVQFDPHAHWSTQNNGALGIYDYVSKDNNSIFMYGTPPACIQKRKNPKTPKKTQFQVAVEMVKEGKYNEIQEERVYAQYQRFFDQLAAKAEPSKRWKGQLKEKNHWIYGPPGSGKSSAVWDAAEDKGLAIYQKLQNKWWDGFKGEDIVLIEDADPETMKKLANHMKIWSDRYPFTYEVKGSSKTMKCPSYYFVVTSNYPMSDCFNGTDLKAMERRFEEHFKDTPSVEEEDQ